MSTEVSAPPAPSKQKYLPLIAMVFVTSMTFIDMTIVSIASPEVEQELGISDADIQWVINGYLLSLAALFALAGRIADVYGHKRMAIVGTVVFAISSTLCGLTPIADYSAAWIITFRIIQGAGAAMLFPAALAIVVAAFPLRERGRALAIFFAVTGAFTAIGPIAGGYLVEWTWRSIFWINIPIAIIAVILTAMCKPSIQPKKEKIDWIGGVLIVAGMGLSVLGFQQASQWGWGSAATILCIAVGLIIVGIFIWFETKQETPLIKMRIFKDRAFIADNFTLFFAMMTFVPIFFFLSMYSQIVLGYNASDSGLFIMWYFVGFVVASQIAGNMLDRIGSKVPLLIGCVVGAVGYGVWAYQSTQMTSGSITPWIVVAGAGLGFIVGPASTDAVNRAIGASYGEVTGITQTLRNYGSALGMAILGTVMLSAADSRMLSTLTGLGLSQSQAEQIITSTGNGGGGGAAGAAANIPNSVMHAIQLDFAQAIQIVLYIMAGMMVLALFAALIHPGGRVELPADAPEEEKAEPTAADARKELIKRIVVFAIVFAVLWVAFTYL